jgi:hypothetical protein
MKTLAAAAIIAQASVSLFATAAPLNVDLIGRELPTPVSVTTAKTYLAARKQSLIFYRTPISYRASCLPARMGVQPYFLQSTHVLVHQKA